MTENNKIPLCALFANYCLKGKSHHGTAFQAVFSWLFSELVSKVHVNFPEVTNCKSGIVYFIFERKVTMAQSRKMIIFVS